MQMIRDKKTSLFVYGEKTSFDKDGIFQLLNETGREGHYCCLISIPHYAKPRICDLKTLTLRGFVDGLQKSAGIINAKDDTINSITDIPNEIFQ